MCSLESLKIDLKGLKEGETSLAYDLGDAYFGALDGAEVSRGDVHVSLAIRRAGSFFELLLHAEGMVVVPCDRCLDDMEQPIETESRFTARLGAAGNEESDEVAVDENEGTLDLSWLIYEAIALAIPIQHVHAPGECDRAMAEKLEEHSVARGAGATATGAVDARWEALLKLKD